jgi:plasmid stabilization system protein ParE
MGRKSYYRQSLAGTAMMEIKWTNKALSDLVRLYDFLTPINKRAAATVVQSLTSATSRLKEHPYVGEKLEEFDPREVRRILAGHYEMRYEIHSSCIYVLRIWHTREER